MCCKYCNVLLAALILVFSFLDVIYSREIVAILALILLVKEVYFLSTGKTFISVCPFCKKDLTKEIFDSIPKGRVNKVPSRKEVSEVLGKRKRK